MIIPDSALELSFEETEYIDGGFYVSNEALINILIVVGMNPLGGFCGGL